MDTFKTDDEGLEVPIEHLQHMAEQGFPRMTLGDLLALIDQYCNFPVPLLSGAVPQKNVAASLLEVLCQTTCAAVVLGGQTSNPTQLLKLKDSLIKFQTVLGDVLALDTMSKTQQRWISAFQEHTKDRLDLVNEEIKNWTSFRQEQRDGGPQSMLNPMSESLHSEYGPLSDACSASEVRSSAK